MRCHPERSETKSKDLHLSKEILRRLRLLRMTVSVLFSSIPQLPQKVPHLFAMPGISFVPWALYHKALKKAFHFFTTLRLGVL